MFPPAFGEPGRPVDAGESAGQLRRFRILAVAVLFTVLGVIWGGIALQLQREHADAVERVELDTGNLAVAFEKYVESSLRGIDLPLVVMRDLWLHQPQAIGLATQHLLTSRQGGGLALQYLIVDASGKVVYATGPRNDGPSVAEQEFFRTHRRAAELAAAGESPAESLDRLHLGNPVRGTAGQWLMFCSRPVYDAARQFRGVVAVVVDTAHFSRSLESLDLGSRGVATLALRGGSVIARSVGRGAARPVEIGTQVDWPEALRAQKSARAGILRLNSPLDGEARILSFRQHPEYPIWVGVGKSEREVLASFYQLSVYYGAVAALASIALGGLMLLLVRARARLVGAKAETLEETSRYRGLFDNLPEGVVIFDAERGEVLAFNDAARVLLGRTPESMHLLSPDDLQLDDSPGGRRDVRLTGPGDQPVDVERSVTRFTLAGRDALQCLLRDVTPLRRAEAELRASRNLYQSLVWALHEGVVLHLENGTIAACNPAAERILGLTAAELVGRHSVDLRWPAIREDGSIFPGAQHPAIVALASGKPQRDVLMGLCKPAGEVTWISINAEPLRHRPDDPPHAVVVSFTDVTARRAAEQAQREATKVLAATGEAVVAAQCVGLG